MQSCKGVAGPKKHKCPDCTFCQWCADTRCKVCRRDREKAKSSKKKITGKKKKLK